MTVLFLVNSLAVAGEESMEPRVCAPVCAVAEGEPVAPGYSGQGLWPASQSSASLLRGHLVSNSGCESAKSQPLANAPSHSLLFSNRLFFLLESALVCLGGSGVCAFTSGSEILFLVSM